jgi:hypothetical protein
MTQWGGQHAAEVRRGSHHSHQKAAVTRYKVPLSDAAVVKPHLDKPALHSVEGILQFC